MADKRKISLVLADVDGTLVTEQKVLTKRAQAAVHSLREAGIRFAITSGRPAKGMAMLFDPLQLDTPISGFNGGLVIKPDFTIIEQKTVPADVAAQVGRADPRAHGLDVWVYRGNDWLVGKADGPHVEHEAWTVKFEPKVVADVADEARPGLQDRRRQRRSGQGAAAARPTPQATFGQRATANRSQPYYLDVTNKDANKGAVVEFLSRHLGVPAAEIATIGDQPTDVPMFKRSGFSIAMGNASDRGEGAGHRRHGFLQRRRLRQGDGTLHPGRMIEVRHGDERAHRSTSRSGGTRAPRGRVDDGGGPCRARSLPGVAFRRIDSEGSLRAARLQ